MMALGIERTEKRWRLHGGGLSLEVDRATGNLARLKLAQAAEVWTEQPGDVTVRDDRLERAFGAQHLDRVRFEEEDRALIVRKIFRGAPWQLTEIYRLEDDALAWEATVTLDAGDYRSCEVSYRIPWHLPLHPMRWWAAKEGMPSAPHRFAEIALEYGEICSGITIPALCCYQKDLNLGLLLAMPFDFRTPRFRFISGYRDPDLQVSFDWLALAPGQPATARFFLRACEPDWRPALGWLYERYREYFEPRSTLIHNLWGGHVSGHCDVSVEDARKMAALGLKWHEIHEHFPAYGNYHPEGLEKWRSGHAREKELLISVEMIRQTIRNLHAAGVAALPYMQLSGDGDSKLLDPKFDNSRVRDWYGAPWASWPGTSLMNSDPALPFGQDMIRQIDGIVKRYPEMDGIFVDQPCYSFLDTAHDDGITAVNNRPCYLTSWNFAPHLEHLSRLLHPRKAIIANGPFAIWQMKYIDGVMAEALDWLIDQMQYYTIGRKPLYFLEYDTRDRNVEQMFQRCLLQGAGFASYADAAKSRDLYDQYLPLLQRLFHRRWVFDPEPLQLPAGYRGNLFRGATGSLLAGIVSALPRKSGRHAPDNTVMVRAADIASVQKVTLQQVGGAIETIPFRQENGGLQFDLPDHTVAAVVELEALPRQRERH